MNNNKKCKKKIIPPYLLEYIANNCDSNDKKCILNTLEHVNELMKKSVKEDPHPPKDNSIIYNKKTLPETENTCSSSGK
ncbi:peptidase M4 [Xenorhabdus mauleonii]|uniref:Peptidase M4 n=2 Tax=Xenorhabdus mauleonii TaxID=351675 RepID=A0A1I3JJR9_9GAMM|nr:peptidase M4 [Xenorhabdus mauleonii]SFI60380.1 Protealysin propeptide [Xenorhabdus mauleonii]